MDGTYAQTRVAVMQTDRIHLRREPVSGSGPGASASASIDLILFFSFFFLVGFCSCLLQAQNVGTRPQARPAGHKWMGGRGRAIPTDRWMGNDRQGVGEERVG